MLKLTHEGPNISVKIKLEGKPTVDTAISALARLLRAAGYHEDSICEGLAECEEAADYYSGHGIKVLTIRGLIDALDTANLSPDIQHAVVSAVFGKEDV